MMKEGNSMKKLMALLCVCALLLSACGGETAPETEAPKETQAQAALPVVTEAPVIEPQTVFYMQDKVNAFSGVGPVA